MPTDCRVEDADGIQYKEGFWYLEIPKRSLTRVLKVKTKSLLSSLTFAFYVCLDFILSNSFQKIWEGGVMIHLLGFFSTFTTLPFL